MSSMLPDLSSLFFEGTKGNQDAYRSFLIGAAANIREHLQHRRKIQTPHYEELLQEVLIALHEKRCTCTQSVDFDNWFAAVIDYKVREQTVYSPRRLNMRP